MSKRIYLYIVALTFALALCFANKVEAQETIFDKYLVKEESGWSKADVARQVAVTGLLYVDMQQTLYIMAHKDAFHEKNPHISQNKNGVYTHFIGSAILWAGVAHFLEPEQRKVFQYVTIGFQLDTIRNNKQIGVKVSF